MYNYNINDEEFIPSSNLNNLSFYLYCPSITEKQRSFLIKLIYQHKGVIKKYIIYIILIYRIVLYL